MIKEKLRKNRIYTHILSKEIVYNGWVVIKDNEIHITHVTIACLWKREMLFDINASIPIVIKKEGKLCYPEDDNNIQAWG